MKKKALFFSMLLYSVNAFALEARLSPNPIMAGESTELIISSDKPLEIPENLRELTENFMISGQQQRKSSQFINGVGSTTYELAYVLFPLKQKDLTIPALQVGSEKTAPLTLKIVNKNEDSGVKDLPILELTASVSDNKPYVGQTIFYQLVLTDGQGLINGEIIPGKIGDGRLEQIGEDTAEAAIKNGTRVQEIKRNYTFTPDKEGKIELSPALFNGTVAYHAPHPTDKRKFFGLADAETLFVNFFDTTRPVSFVSNPVVIEVQPKPSHITGWWLPSTKVELKEDYRIPQVVQVGDTLTLDFTLTAQDVNANDMPIPRLTDSEDFRIYPKPEERSTTIKGEHLLGQVDVSFTLVPLKAGKIEIPAVTVDWFNTSTKKTETAVVPARQLTIEQGETTSVLKTEEQQVLLAPVEENKPSQQPETPRETWILVLVGVMIGLGIGVLLLFLWYLYKSHVQKKKEKPLPDFYAFK